jgi:uncharacterized membrane protein
MSRTKHRPPILPVRIVRLHGRLAVAIAVGVAAALLLPMFGLASPTCTLLGWDIGAAFYLVTTFAMMGRTDVATIRKRAAEADEGALAILVLSIVATIASLVAIVAEIGASKQAQGAAALGHVLLGTATILLSWTFVHTIFSFHYAHEFYGERRDGKIGGLEFPGDNKPDYRDFLYFSLVIGMTSQVSDVAISSKFIRRVAAIHGVLSFFFNLTVLALTVNMVSNLI